MNTFQTIRGGIDSAWWLINNVQNHDMAVWETFVIAARQDRARALEALENVREALQQMPCDHEHLTIEGAFVYDDCIKAQCKNIELCRRCSALAGAYYYETCDECGEAGCDGWCTA